MKAESNVKPTKFEIENIQDDRCEVVLYDNIHENNEDDIVKYEFDLYRLNMCYSDNLGNEIKNNFESYVEIAKKKEYKILADEIRKKRNELLEETDKEMCIDRLSIDLPESLTATNLLGIVKKLFENLSNIKNGKMALYRQALRDITKQEGFPYNVVFPQRPTNENEESKKDDN